MKRPADHANVATRTGPRRMTSNRDTDGVSGIAWAGLAVAAGVALVGLGLTGTNLVRPGLAAAPLGDSTGAPSQGAGIYAEYCAGCHGVTLTGRGAGAARILIPPLDGSGHAWRHSDMELTTIIATGIQAPASAGGQSMPAFRGRLKPIEIDAVVGFVKSQWPSTVQDQQTLLNIGALRIATLLRYPDLLLPGDCLPWLAPERSGDHPPQPGN